MSLRGWPTRPLNFARPVGPSHLPEGAMLHEQRQASTGKNSKANTTVQRGTSERKIACRLGAGAAVRGAKRRQGGGAAEKRGAAGGAEGREWGSDDEDEMRERACVCVASMARQHSGCVWGCCAERAAARNCGCRCVAGSCLWGWEYRGTEGQRPQGGGGQHSTCGAADSG